MLPADFMNDIASKIGCEIRIDDVTKILYSTDASIYQIEPMGVVYPRTQDELVGICEISNRYKIPILPRGSGSSLAGQAIGSALILDCSRHLNRIVNIDQEEKTAVVEPGVILSQLNSTLSKMNLQFGPDPASAERATMGGSLANNATGAHSIQYGLSVDHLLAVDVALSDGSLANFSDLSIKEAMSIASGKNVESNIYKTALMIRSEFTDEIYTKWPRTWRRVSGYNLNYLIPWSKTYPANWYQTSGSKLLDEKGNRIDNGDNLYPPVGRDTINLAKLIAGSEGTLAVIKRATINLVDLPRYTILGVLAYQNIAQACDDLPDLLLHNPSAIELIPNTLIKLAKSIPAYAHQLKFINELNLDNSGRGELLVVEFSGDDPDLLNEKAKSLGRNVIIARSYTDQQKIWRIRKVGLGILMSRPGNTKPISIIEDTAVPVEQLGIFVREMERIMIEHETEADFYAHASAGCLHIRPLLNLKQTDGKRKLRSIAEATVDLTLRLGGAMSAEHGDGLARSEWLEKAYGPKILSAFRMIKESADPDYRLNPGKIIDPQPMDKNLRVLSDNSIIEWRTVMNFTPINMETSSLGVLESIELCNGAGVCRKLDGVMCPSFQVTADEMHSTRGRANLLRAMLLNRYKSNDIGAKVVFEALDLCIACKGCKAECPSAVDMAKLKYEYLHLYYQQSANHRKIRDYVFGFIGYLAKVGSPFAAMGNYVLQQSSIKRAGERYLGISAKRDLPLLSRRSLTKKITKLSQPTDDSTELVFFLSDPFTEYFFTDTGLAAIQVLRASGCKVIRLPILGSGRTLISKGFLDHAKAHAERFLNVIERLDPQGMINIVGVEPSEIYTLKDEFIDLLPRDKKALTLASRAYSVDEFLIRPDQQGVIRIDKVLESAPKSLQPIEVFLHGHCYQKSQPPAVDGQPSGVHATKAMLERVNCHVNLIEAGCCGMAGAFGYEVEHYDISMKIGEYGVFPAIRTAIDKFGKNITLLAPGISCRSHISDGTGYKAIHPIELINNRLLS